VSEGKTDAQVDRRRSKEWWSLGPPEAEVQTLNMTSERVGVKMDLKGSPTFLEMLSKR
jgi:hypothetical protein